MKKLPAFAAVSLLSLLTACTGAPLPPATTSAAAPAPIATPDVAQSLPVCMSINGENIRICIAYAVTASSLRFSYYRDSHNANPVSAENALHNLKERYEGAALEQIMHQTDGWPAEVDSTIYGVNVDTITLAADGLTATLTTHETWQFTDTAHQPLLSENSQPHTVTMRKVPSILFEKWIVTDIK
jgi:hypothetical protein